ncbi:hypothetical protein AV530_002527 [Patagioenas fasciata monilis]|uniref:Secreted protein n=1 Tax=Patagioenas fasciata monilis TaxID=372326 RepID=A0A1V4K6Y3_PATFA|nr:hypothetical protein AV530_002527 [Patagioenas fasciata monilis]
MMASLFLFMLGLQKPAGRVADSLLVPFGTTKERTDFTYSCTMNNCCLQSNAAVGNVHSPLSRLNPFSKRPGTWRTIFVKSRGKPQDT